MQCGCHLDDGQSAEEGFKPRRDQDRRYKPEKAIVLVKIARIPNVRRSQQAASVQQ